MNKLGIVGAGGKRRPLDFYPTPPEVTAALLNHIALPEGATIWDPAAGEGAILRVAAAYGYKTIGTDILTGQDFLEQDARPCDMIITNPPFYMAAAFIKKAWALNIPFAFLLRSQYWHAASRLELFTACPPNMVLPLTWRPQFTEQKSGSLLDMVWNVWTREPADNAIYLPLPKPHAGGPNHAGL